MGHVYERDTHRRACAASMGEVTFDGGLHDGWDFNMERGRGPRKADVVLGEMVNRLLGKTNLGSWPGGEGLECQVKEAGLSLVKGHNWHWFCF